MRHNLSLHTRFVKVQNEGTGKSSWWTINPDAKTGKSSRRRSPLDPTKAGGRKRGRSKKRADSTGGESVEGAPALGSPPEAAFLDPQAMLYRTAAGCERLSPGPIGWPYPGRSPYVPDQVGYQPDRNGFHPDRNGFHPERNGFHPERNGFQPDRNGFHPDRNGFHPDRNGFHPDRNGFHPDRNGFHPERNGYNPESNGYLAERNGYLPADFHQDRTDSYSREPSRQPDPPAAEQSLPPPYHGISTTGYNMFCGAGSSGGGGGGGAFSADGRRPGNLMVGHGGLSTQEVEQHAAYNGMQVRTRPVQMAFT